MHHIFPWQQQEWQYLINRRNSGQLPHAILIKGFDGIGKGIFAKSFAEVLLCKSDSCAVTACGECDACQLTKADNHPDLTVVRPEEAGKAIKIDQIRDMVVELSSTSHQGGYRVVIIESAELLNVAAANALLKTLEEPVAHVIIILISSHYMALPATIRSRCQILSMRIPKYTVAKEWLEQQLPDADIKLLLALTENAPLKALDLVNGDGLIRRQEFFSSINELRLGQINSVQMAGRLLNLGLEGLLIAFMYVVNDLVKIKFGIVEDLVNREQAQILSDFANKTTVGMLFAYQDLLCKFRQLLVQKINLNQQLVMENLIMSWTRLFEKK